MKTLTLFLWNTVQFESRRFLAHRDNVWFVRPYIAILNIFLIFAQYYVWWWPPSRRRTLRTKLQITENFGGTISLSITKVRRKELVRRRGKSNYLYYFFVSLIIFIFHNYKNGYIPIDFPMPKSVWIPNKILLFPFLTICPFFGLI